MARILYAEDDPSVAALVDFRLSEEGHDVVVARDGVDARKRLAAGRFEVVLLDVMLPEIDGFTLVGEAAAKEPRPAVIMISARDRREDLEEACRVGADAYLCKPFDPEDLVSVVADHLPGTDVEG